MAPKVGSESENFLGDVESLCQYKWLWCHVGSEFDCNQFNYGGVKMTKKSIVTAVVIYLLCGATVFSAAADLKKFALGSQGSFCAKGNFSLKTIRSSAGSYCHKDIGAAIAMVVCGDAAGFMTSQKGGSDCYQAIQKKHPQLSQLGAAQNFVMNEQNKANVCNFLSQEFGMSTNGCRTALGLSLVAPRCPSKISAANLALLKSKNELKLDVPLKLVAGSVHQNAFEAQYVTTEAGKCYFAQYDSGRNLIITPSLVFEL
jgi:hypothetical protein